MLSAIGLAQPTLKLEVSEDLLYLHPNAHSDEVPSYDPCVNGIVTLYLPKAVKNLGKLVVRLQGRYDIGWPQSVRPFETGRTLKREVNLVNKDGENHFEKGEHRFEFSIIVPSNTAPYERSGYGRIKHYLSAKCKGIGLTGTDVLSPELEICLVCNPGGAGESSPPPPLSVKSEGVVQDFGPYIVTMSSAHIMVGGLLLLRFNLISVPQALEFYSIKVRIAQTFTLTSIEDPRTSYVAPVDRRLVLEIDAANPVNNGALKKELNHRNQSRPPLHAPFATVKPEGDFSLTHLARLPSDNFVRPSTQHGTETPIHISHQLVVEIVYRVVPDGEEAGGSSSRTPAKDKHKKVMSISKPLDLFSCCCFLDSLTLPEYHEKDPMLTRTADDFAPPCICHVPLDRLIGYQGLPLLLKEEGNPDFDPSSTTTKIEPYRSGSYGPGSRSDSQATSRSNSQAPSRSNSRAPSRSNSRAPSPTGMASPSALSAGPSSSSLGGGYFASAVTGEGRAASRGSEHDSGSRPPTPTGPSPAYTLRDEQERGRSGAPR